jgi:CheY-like chemotaxis protein
MTLPLSILIVEDEPLIAMMLEDFLDGLGHNVAGAVDCVEDALARVAEGGFDVAILDVHLRDGAAAWPVADALADKGVTFLVATGGLVEPLPARHAQAPMLPKPYTIDGVKSALEAARAAQ